MSKPPLSTPPAGRIIALVIGLAAAVMTDSVAAQDRGVVFAGGEAGEESSAYAGITWSAPGARLGEGWAARAIVSAGEYDYQGGPGLVEAEFVQADLVLLRQSSGDWGYLNLGAGARFTDTDLEPSDPGNDRDGQHWDGVLVVDGAADAGPWRAGGYAIYGVRMREYYVRGDLTRRVSAFRLGVEALAEGDESYDRTRAGLLAVYEPTPRYALRGAVGARDDGDAYASIGLTRSF